MTNEQIEQQTTKYVSQLEDYYDEADKCIARRAYRSAAQWAIEQMQGEVDNANEKSEYFAYQCEKTARKRQIDECAKWIRENVGADVAVDFLNSQDKK